MTLRARVKSTSRLYGVYGRFTVQWISQARIQKFWAARLKVERLKRSFHTETCSQRAHWKAIPISCTNALANTQEAWV